MDDKLRFKIIESEVKHLRELMEQHDKATELAISKSETVTNERFYKANEFREQQKDIIGTFARQKEVTDALDTLATRMDNSVSVSTARFEANVRTMNDKIEILSAHLSDKINSVENGAREGREMLKKGVDDKRDTLYAGIIQKFEDMKLHFDDKLTIGIKTVDDKITSNIRVETARFASQDVAMDTRINANAEVSNNGIKSLNDWRIEQQGNMKLIYGLGGIVITICTGILIYYITHMIGAK